MSLGELEIFAPNMPAVAVEQLSKQGVIKKALGDGINEFVMSGHDKGVAYRFFMHHLYNAQKSDKLEYEVYDDVEMIQWIVNRRKKPVEQVRFLPSALLKWNRRGELIGGRYKENYERWKKGEHFVGTPLISWGVLTSGEVASMEAEGVFTVEQFAEIPTKQVQSRFSQSIAEAHKRAVHYVAASSMQQKDVEQAEELIQVKKQNIEILEQNAKLLERVTQMERAINGSIQEAQPEQEPAAEEQLKPIVEVRGK